MPFEEQTAWKQPKIRRASRPASQQNAGHQAGLHPEDTPRQTTQSHSRKPIPVVYDNTDDDVYTDRRMPTVIKRYNRLPVPTQTRVREEVPIARVTPLRFFLIAVGVILSAFVLAMLLIAYALPALTKWHDDHTYGYPRTIHTRAIVGHGTKEFPYSNFTGENINGYMYVIELQEIDPTQNNPHIYFINRFSGQQKDLLAITAITFVDENGDGKVDMLVTMENGSTFVLYNNGKTFTPTMSK